MAQRTMAGLRHYSDKKWLIALLIGAGLGLTGWTDIWLGFVFLLVAVALFLSDYFRFIQRRPIRYLVTGVVVLAVFVISSRVMQRTEQSPIEPAGQPQAYPLPSQAPRQLKLIFKNSPLFTDERKARITADMEAFYEYLVWLGLDPPKEIPPIGVTNTGVFRSSIQYPAPIYQSEIYIPEKLIDDPRAAQHAYARYCFPSLLGVYNPNRQDGFRGHIAALIFQGYFGASFSGIPPVPGDHQIAKWTAVLWNIREKIGQSSADQIAAFTLKSFREYSDLNPKREFDEYFNDRLRSGMYVVDNRDGPISHLEQIIRDSLLANSFLVTKE